MLYSKSIYYIKDACLPVPAAEGRGVLLGRDETTFGATFFLIFGTVFPLPAATEFPLVRNIPSVLSWESALDCICPAELCTLWKSSIDFSLVEVCFLILATSEGPDSIWVSDGSTDAEPCVLISLAVWTSSTVLGVFWVLSVLDESPSLVADCDEVVIVVVDSFVADCCCSSLPPLPVVDPSLVFLRRLLGRLVSPTCTCTKRKEIRVDVHLPQLYAHTLLLTDTV